jgi:hypothetical protein
VTLPNIPENLKLPADENTESKMAADEQPQAQADSDMKGMENTPPTIVPENGELRPSTPQRPSTSSGWLGWFGRSPLPDTPTQIAQPAQSLQPSQPAISEPPSEPPKEAEQGPVPPPQVTVSEPADTQQNATPKPPAATTYWFDFWSASQTPKPQETEANVHQDINMAPEPPKEQQDVVMEDAPPPTEEPSTEPAPQSSAPQPSAGSTWAFWSRDTKVKPISGRSTPQPESGELAVIGEGSEAHPQPASSADVKDEPAKGAPKDAKGKAVPVASTPTKKNKRLRPQSMEIDLPLPSTAESSTMRLEGASTPSKQAVMSKPDVAQKGESSRKASPAKETPTKPLPPNLLLPSFSSTYYMKENPSILKQIAQLLLRTQQPAANHVFKAKEPPKVKKALAIGVHGLFPAAYLRPMIGQPTGTSLRFASLCADAIRRWADKNGCGTCEIEKVALEGDGKIADRVDNLWRLLLNWIDHIRSADLILLACHSQGVPVAVMLLAKLIDLGIITDAKIGVCAMAGVSLGPFPDYKSSMGIFMGSAGELWDFSNPESEVSQRYEHALKEVLQYGVRITYIGSIDDQLVPLESAIYSPANHPYIYRAVFIDGRIHAPDL